MEKAKDFANKPETKEKIEQAREKLAGKDKGGNGVQHSEGNGVKHSEGNGVKTPTGQSEPTAPPAGEQPAQGNPPQTP